MRTTYNENWRLTPKIVRENLSGGGLVGCVAIASDRKLIIEYKPTGSRWPVQHRCRTRNKKRNGPVGAHVKATMGELCYIVPMSVASITRGRTDHSSWAESIRDQKVRSILLYFM